MMTLTERVVAAMFLRPKDRAVPLVLLVISSVWMAALVFPLFYSLCFPNADIRHIVRAFEGKETLQKDLAPLREATLSVGRLKRAIQVAAYLGASAGYEHGESHTAKTTELSYLAWFERRSKATILVVSRTETEGSGVHFDIREGNPFDMLRLYVLPASVLAGSIYWYRRQRSKGNTAVEASAATMPLLVPDQIEKSPDPTGNQFRKL